MSDHRPFAHSVQTALARSELNVRRFQKTLLALLIAIFVAVATEKIWQLRVAAERTHVAWMVGSIRSALGVKSAAMVVTEGLEGFARLEGVNPIILLDAEKLPPNYLGEREHPAISTIAPYHWYFDRRDHVLVYRLGNPEFVEMASATDSDLLHFRVHVGYSDRNGDGVLGQGDALTAIELVEMDSYRWNEEWWKEINWP